MDACECGYDGKGDKRNLAKHKKRCPKRALQLLESENKALRLQLAAGTIDVERRIQTQMDDLRTTFQRQLDHLQTTVNALVPATQTTINNVAIQINLCAFEDTPLPSAKKVKSLFDDPWSSVPTYFELKHGTQPSSRNLKITDKNGTTTISVYTKGKGGNLMWVEKDKAATLDTLVDKLIGELWDKFNGRKHEEFDRWCINEGLLQANNRDYPAFKTAEKSIHSMLLD